MHPHSAKRNGALGARADEAKRHSSLVRGSPAGTRTTPALASTHTPRNALLSPRPLTTRSTPSKGPSSRKGSRQGTPLSSCDTTAATFSHRESLTSTPAQRTGTGSARGQASSVAAGAGGAQHDEAAQRTGERRSTPYQAPPTSTASPLSLQPRRHKVVRAARRDGSGSAHQENEPFGDSVAASPAVVTTASPSVPPAEEVKTTTTSSTQPHDVVRREKALRSPLAPAASRAGRRETLALTAAAEPSPISPHPNSSSAADGVDVAESTWHHFRLPHRSEDELQRLFHALRCYESGSGNVWSFHRHLVPFVTAHAADILPVGADELLAFLGDSAAEARCAHNNSSNAGSEIIVSDTQKVAAKTVARFVSEMYSWFFCVGGLGCGPALSWQVALCGEVDDVDDTVTSTTAAAAPSRDSSTWADTVIATPVKQRTRSIASYSSSPAASPTTLPQPLQLVSTDSDGDAVKAAAVKGETRRVEKSARRRCTAAAARASSTFASVKFHSVVEVPPFVTSQAFVQGLKVLQRLLTERAVHVAESEDEDHAQQLRRALCSTAPPGHKSGLSFHASPAVRAGLRRARFYIRLYSFVRVLTLRCCAAAGTPPLVRSADAVESVLLSRLYTNASTPSTTGIDKKTQKMAQAAEVPRVAGFLVRQLLHRCLHNAILRCPPAAVARGARNASAVDTLDVLLTLRSREAERVVRWAHCTESCPNGVPRVRVNAVSSASVHRALPASLLLLFPLPRWSPWHSAKTTSSGRWADTLVRAALVACLLFTLSCCPLLYYVAYCLELDWMPSWDAPSHRSSEGIEAVSGALDAMVLQHAVAQVAALASVVMLTRLLGRTRGAAIATLEVQYRLCASQAARLTAPAVAMWIYSAWALRTETAVGAAAAQRCLTRLALACRGAAAATLRRNPRHRLRALTCVPLCESVLVILLGTLLERYVTHHACVSTLSLCLVLVAAWRSVINAWRERRGVLMWWLQCQAALAEGTAADILHAVSAAEGARWPSLHREGEEQPVLRLSSPAAPSELANLCVVPLPFLEELVKVQYLFDLCERTAWRHSESFTDVLRTQHVSPFEVQRLADFPRHCFWDQLCGHTVVAYATDTPAVEVVERVSAAAAQMTSELQTMASPSSVSSAAVEPLLQLLLVLLHRLLPWIGDRPCCAADVHVSDVMAPVVAALALLQEDGGRGAYASTDSSAPLDVRLRRTSYLSEAQQRLLVCAAVAFASFGTHAPCSKSSNSSRETNDTCISEHAMVCLVHLVYHQRAATNGSAVARWREATRRTREALRLTQHVSATQRLGCGVDSVFAKEGRYSLLPQLHNVLFA